MAVRMEKSIRDARKKHKEWGYLLKRTATNRAFGVDFALYPVFFGAFLRCSNQGQIMYRWMKDPKLLEGLIKLCESGPDGISSAVDVLHYFDSQESAGAGAGAQDGK